MQITVNLINNNKIHELELLDNATAIDTLKMLDIPPDTVIVMRNGKPIPLDSVLDVDDELSVIRVVSGG